MITVTHINDLPRDEGGHPIFGPGDRYIGRANRWARKNKSPYCNPFKESDYGREECLRLFRIHILAQPDLIERARHDFAGDVRLVCYCFPARCHGHIWQEVLHE